MAVLGSLLWDSIAVVVLLVVIAYLYGTAHYNYFKKRGIPYVKPLPFVGNFGGVLIGTLTFTNSVKPLYDELKTHSFGGVFQSRFPALILCDPELIKIVLTRDFYSVHDHGVPFDEENDPLTMNLFSLPGARWKNLRAKLSPAFTSEKLKQMLPLMIKYSKDLIVVLSERAETKEIVELKEILTRFATDVIGSCAFGIECNCLKNPQSVFYTNAQNYFKRSFFLSLYILVLSHSKLLSKIVPFHKLFPNLESFFIDLMQDTIKYRKSENVERNDFVQLLMKLQKNDEGKTRETHPDEVIVTDSIVATQAFFFFLDGLHSIAGTVGFTLHHMSLDPRIQEDVADEVLSVTNHHDGHITYEGLKGMTLLDMVVSETLRMYPPGGTIRRVVTAPKYTIPGTDFTVEKGMKVLIPVYGLHHDSEIYPEPAKFDPYRFTKEASSKRHTYTYLPFGEGPRVCIANRFARLEVKLCLASLIKNFKFSVCSKTEIPIQLQTHSSILGPINGFNLRVEKRTV